MHSSELSRIEHQRIRLSRLCGLPSAHALTSNPTPFRWQSIPRRRAYTDRILCILSSTPWSPPEPHSTISALGQRLHTLARAATLRWIVSTGRPLLGTRRRHRIRHPAPQDIASQGGRQGSPRRVQAQGAAHPKGKGGVQEPPRRQAELVGRYVQMHAARTSAVIDSKVLSMLEEWCR